MEIISLLKGKGSCLMGMDRDGMMRTRTRVIKMEGPSVLRFGMRRMQWWMELRGDRCSFGEWADLAWRDEVEFADDGQAYFHCKFAEHYYDEYGYECDFKFTV